MFTYSILLLSRSLRRCSRRRRWFHSYETVQTADNKLPLRAYERSGGEDVGPDRRDYPTEGERGERPWAESPAPPAKVVIIGGGTVGTNAAKIAKGMGADVTIFDNNLAKPPRRPVLRQIRTQFSTAFNAQAMPTTDLRIGAVLVPGAKAPKLVSDRRQVDETRFGHRDATTRADAWLLRQGDHPSEPHLRSSAWYYSVANIPGAVPRTSTIALITPRCPMRWRSRTVGLMLKQTSSPRA